MPTTTERFAPGQFCWTELLSTDTAASRAFYTTLFNWHGTDMPLPDGNVYTIFDVGGANVSALAKADDGATRWASYLATNDVDASVATARAAGATIDAGPFDVMDAGRMAILRDPAGVPLRLWQGGRNPGSALRDAEAGSLCWHDIYSHDANATVPFLKALFGYEIETAETPHGPFSLLTAQGCTENEIAVHQMADFPPSTQPFFSVADADAVHAKAVELGAEVMCPPMDMGAGRFAHFRDPQGATFAIFEWANKG